MKKPKLRYIKLLSVMVMALFLMSGLFAQDIKAAFVNKVGLKVAIMISQTNLTSHPVGMNIGNVTQTSHDDYNLAINTAKDIYLNPTATQSQINSEITTLNAAKTSFNSNIIRNFNIVSIGSLPNIKVAKGTLLTNILTSLPRTIQVVLTHNLTENLPVIWAPNTSPTYNSTLPGTYLLTGTISLKANTTNSTNKKASVNIIVASIPVTDITVTGANGTTSVTNGQTLQMSSTILPSNATNNSVSWSTGSSGDTGTATINSNGLLSATGVGTVTVTATAKDGSGVSGSESITVISAVSSDADLGDLQVSQGTLSPVFNPDTVSYSDTLDSGTTTIPTVTASTDDSNATEVITQAQDLPGTATVVVTAQDGTTTKTYTIDFSVEAQPAVLDITKISDLPEIDIPINTTPSGTLPSTNIVTLSDNSTVTLPVVWASDTTPSFNASTAGTYVLAGTLTLPQDGSITNTQNLEPSLNIVVTPASVSTETSLWNSSETPQSATTNDSSSTELGVKFSSNENGYITGIKFYKGDTTNGGVHIGNLWSSSGELLSTATFSNETDSGWQQANFATPIQISADTTYIASYFSPQGHYAGDAQYFAQSLTNGPLQAPAGDNGIYQYSSTSAFPTQTFNSTNYWVDVIFTPTI